jgi:DNA polymerase-4
MIEPDRKIIHCDADCFFAALEMREDPRLRDIPIAVGGSEKRRGVISTCNYEARRFGVHSAMASAHAKQLCPQLVIVPANFELYRQAANQLREIFHHYTDLVEPLSLDEAFLDVSNGTQCRGSATLMAREIRRTVEGEIGITVSAGVSSNKFLAKVASDWQKPNGLTVVEPHQIDNFVRKLPVKRLFGVGKVTAQRLHRMGIESCAQLQQLDKVELTQAFGSMGLRMYDLCRGIDNRSVKSQWRRQSLSVEHTYPNDLNDLSRCLSEIPSLFQQLHSRLRRLDNAYRVVKGFVKVKFDDFTTTTLERMGSKALLEDYRDLCADAYQRGNRPVRLLGLGVRLLDENKGINQQQLCLF